jgi:hypothetical protein
LLAYGRWFSPGTPVSSTTKTGCHDIAEILLKVALSTKNQNQRCIMFYYIKVIRQFVFFMENLLTIRIFQSGSVIVCSMPQIITTESGVKHQKSKSNQIKGTLYNYLLHMG